MSPSCETRAVAGIQARMSSTRLPGKVLEPLAGRPLIERVVERVRRCVLVEEVFVLTSEEESDDPLVEFLESARIPVRRGSLTDVRSRYLALARELGPDHLVRVTGDCPLVEPDFIDLQLGALRAFDADFVRLAGNERGGLDGTLAGAGVFSVRALEASGVSEDPRDLEHVSSFYFQEHAEDFRHVEIEVHHDYDRPGLRLCVDEPEDLAFVRRVFDHFGERTFRTLDALRWLDAQPELRELHAHVAESDDNQAYRRLLRSIRPRVVGRYRRMPA